MSDDLTDSDLKVKTSRNKEKQSYVIMISHEADFVPFELTSVDILTQFFTDWNNIRTGVRSYIIDEEYPVRELVHLPNYVKELCDVHTVAAAIASGIDWQTEKEYGPSPVTFLLCRGSKRDEETPAFLNFGAESREGDGHTRHVWACKPKQQDYFSTVDILGK
jgi:hypothetical protein